MRRQTSAEQGAQMWEAECYQLWFSLKEKRLVASAHMLVAYICMLYIFVGWLGSFVGNLIVFSHFTGFTPGKSCRWWKGGDVHARVWRQWSLSGQNLRCWGTAAIAMGWQKAILHPKDGHELWRLSELQKNIHESWMVNVYIWDNTPPLLKSFHSGNRSYRRIMSRAMYLIRRVITTWVFQGFWAWLWSISRRNSRYKQRLIWRSCDAAPKKCNRNTCRSMADIRGWCRQSYQKEKLYQDSWKGFFSPNIS